MAGIIPPTRVKYEKFYPSTETGLEKKYSRPKAVNLMRMIPVQDDVCKKL